MDLKSNIPQQDTPLPDTLSNEVLGQEASGTPSEPKIDSITTAEASTPPKVDLSSLYPVPGQLKHNATTSESTMGGKLSDAQVEKASAGGSSVLRILVGIGVILTPVLSLLLTVVMAMIYSDNASTLYKGILQQKDIGAWLELIWSLYFGNAAGYSALSMGILSAGGITMSLIYITLGVGTLLKKEAARIALVVFMVISSVSMAYSMVSYGIAQQESDKRLASYEERKQAQSQVQSESQSTDSVQRTQTLRDQSDKLKADAAAAQSEDQRKALERASARVAQMAQDSANREMRTSVGVSAVAKKNEPLIPLTHAVGIVSILFNAAVIFIMTRQAIRQQFR